MAVMLLQQMKTVYDAAIIDLGIYLPMGDTEIWAFTG